MRFVQSAQRARVRLDKACPPRYDGVRMVKNTATIEDIHRLALPASTRLLTGEEHIGRVVTWACSLRPSPPAFPKLDGNELALIDMEDLRRLDPQMRLDRVVQSLVGARVSAIAVQGPIDGAAVQAARANHIPLFQLPADAPMIQVERGVIRFIVDRAGYIAQRSAELQRELNQAALDGGDLPCIAQRVQQFAQQPVIILREDGHVSAWAGLEALTDAQRAELFARLPNPRLLRTAAAQHQGATPEDALSIIELESMPDMGYGQAVVAPVLANDAVRGYCLLLRGPSIRGSDISSVEQIAGTQCSAAAALEWAKRNSVELAVDRMRAAFVDELLAAEIADEQAWVQRGASLGFDLTRPHVAWLVESKGIADWPAPLLRFVEERGLHVPTSKREEGMLLYWPTENPKSGREHKATAGDFVARMESLYPRARLLIGIGRPATGPAAWLHSLQQARESWRLGKEWKSAPVTYFGDLGLYQLLTNLGTNAEAARFFRKTLARLIAYDKEKHADLVGTLEAFFATHGNLSQTAARLRIHRNTLTYRLEQISTITQLDLDDADARFSLQLALKLRPILR